MNLPIAWVDCMQLLFAGEHEGLKQPPAGQIGNA